VLVQFLFNVWLNYYAVFYFFRNQNQIRRKCIFENGLPIFYPLTCNSALLYAGCAVDVDADVEAQFRCSFVRFRFSRVFVCFLQQFLYLFCCYFGFICYFILLACNTRKKCIRLLKHAHPHMHTHARRERHATHTHTRTLVHHSGGSEQRCCRWHRSGSGCACVTQFPRLPMCACVQCTKKNRNFPALISQEFLPFPWQNAHTTQQKKRYTHGVKKIGTHAHIHTYTGTR